MGNPSIKEQWLEDKRQLGVELPEHWFDREMAWSQNYLADLARQLTNGREIDVQTEVLDGDPATEIITYTSLTAEDIARLREAAG